MPLALKRSVVPAPASFFEDVSLDAPAEGKPLRVTWLPDGRTRIIYMVFHGSAEGALWIAGPRTRALYLEVPCASSATVMSLRPGASARLLGVAAHELTDRLVPLEETWGASARDLGDELGATGGVQGVVAALSRRLAARARAAPELTADRLARRAVRLLEADGARVTEVAGQLGVTPRHLRRAFTESVGVGPKDFARAVRLQRAVRRAATSRDWKRIAAEAGYYDQAHFIGDFRELVGLTPSAYFDERVARPLSGICGAA